MAGKPLQIPRLLARPHPRDRARRLAFVSFTTPEGKRRQKVMGEAGSPQAERAYREFLAAYLAGQPLTADGRAAADLGAEGHHVSVETVLSEKPAVRIPAPIRVPEG